MVDLQSLLSQLRRSLPLRQVEFKVKAISQPETPTNTVVLDRELSNEERALAKWLLLHSTPGALSFLPQLENARVTGKCDCGCPTIHIRVDNSSLKAEPISNPIADAFGKVNDSLVGVMLLQQDGYLTCLEIYDLSEITHPYELPEYDSLEPAVWSA